MRLIAFIFLICVLTWIGVASANPTQLTLYCGRKEPLVKPLIDQFEEQTGVQVKVKYAKTAQLALLLNEEGAHSPADLFWSQDAGALGALAAESRFEQLPKNIAQLVPQRFCNPDGYWVATSGRARVLAYSPKRTTEPLPRSVFSLTDRRFRSRVGWAPTNASFQAFVTAMRHAAGPEATREWLQDMQANGAKAYSMNTAILQAIAAGEVDFGLPNHYYLLRFKATDPDYPVEQTTFAAGDIGNLINVAGIAVLGTSQNKQAALRFVAFLLEAQSQQYFATETEEYPVTDDLERHPVSPEIQLDDLKDLSGTLDLLHEVGLI